MASSFLLNLFINQVCLLLLLKGLLLKGLLTKPLFEDGHLDGEINISRWTPAQQSQLRPPLSFSDEIYLLSFSEVVYLNRNLSIAMYRSTIIFYSGTCLFDFCTACRLNPISFDVSPTYYKGLRDFPDREDLEAGDEISDATKEAISRALVHIAIFDPGYANCPRCIDELKLMFQTDKKIIPIFDHVEPSDLRWVAQRGVYYEAFSEFEKKGIYPPQKLEEWKIALAKASEISGHKFNDYENDQGLLVDKIVSNVRDEIRAAYGKYPVFINNRGIDVKNSLASTIYHTLKLIGVGSFLDTKELKPGEKFPDAINEAISGALIHIAIFSPNYAQSSWCLNELTRMLQSGTKIIPIFYNVNPCDLKLVAEGKGVYSTAFSKHEKDGRYPLEKLEEWKMALSKASAISGYEINQREKNEGLLLKEIVENVMKEMRSAYGRYPFFINHRGIDVENSLASIIYRILNIILAQDFLHSGQLEAGDCRDFLDREQSEAGDCRDFGETPLMRAEDWRYFVDRQADRY